MHVYGQKGTWSGTQTHNFLLVRQQCGQTTAHGPNPAHDAFQCDPPALKGIILSMYVDLVEI